MSLLGRTIGRYRITEKLGEGGMGVVYRAQDQTLGRDVAIKVLRPDLSRQPERVRRFSQEARAASALNHPNIVTVHDAGEFEDGPFLVMELVEGESLRTLVRRGALPLAKVLDIGIQAATALTRAHESGITHRDLKPENLLVRPDGYVKILDFGLAKLKEQEATAEGTTLDAGLTSEGSIVGTAGYMSPEQATARPADARSDIFSLALVLFEAWQGKHPFVRGNVLDTMHAIAHDRLPALSYAVGSPEWGLGRVLEKALEKAPDERYQTMKDLGIDLRRLRQESETSQLAPVAAPPPTRRPLLYAAAGFVLLLLVAGGAWLFLDSRRPAATARLEYTQLTSFADSATSPALSPDGRMLTFIRGTETFAGPGQIYIKLLPDGEPVQLTHDDRNKMSPVFVPGGDRVAYGVTGSMTDLTGWATWTVPVFGGEPRLLLANSSALTWIPGANPARVLFSQWDRVPHMSIVTSAANRSELRTVYSPAGPDAMAHRSSLSPDGRWVLVVEMEGGWRPCRLAAFAGGGQGRLVGPSPGQCTSAGWSPDGRWMYFSVNIGNGYHIWRQRFPDGEPEQVTFGATEEEGIAFFPDGGSFVSSVGTRQSTLWVHDARGERQISSEGYASLPQFSPDGKKLYYLLRSRANRRYVSGELWAANPDTGKRERLLPDFLMEHYSVSPDGNRVVFAGIDETGHTPVWLAALDGRTAPRRLSTIDAVRTFFDAKGEVYFLGAEGENRRFLYRVKEDGSGLQKALPDPVSYVYDISPDGKAVAAWVDGPAVIYPMDGGSPVNGNTLCRAAGGEQRGITPPCVSWSPDGRFIYFNLRTLGKVCAVPLPPGRTLPPLPPSGIGSLEDAARLPGARIIAEQRAFLGPSPSLYAFARVTTHRNIYRIPVP
jgi:serine/threonine protein kinase